MGLRFSLDSSETESNGGPTSTTRTCAPYYQHHLRAHCGTRSSDFADHHPPLRGANITNQRRTSEEASSFTGTNVSDNSFPLGVNSESSDQILRQPEQTNSDDTNFFRLFYANPHHVIQISGRHGRGTTSSAASNVDQLRSSSSYQRQRHGSLLDINASAPSVATREGRARRSEPSGVYLNRWDSNESDNNDGNLLDTLGLSSFMFRHLPIALRSSERARHASVPQPDSDLTTRALRASAVRTAYNVDRLTQNKGECTICLEELAEGNIIARLPCLCVYHKKCIDSWFKRRPVCPEHPGD